MKKRGFWLASVLVLASACLTLIVIGAPGKAYQEQASDILEATGVRGGLIVHLGCGDGRLTMALCRGEAYRVHGLDADADDVERARRLIRSSGLYGPVSVERWDAPRLPYGDNLVNLLVAEGMGRIPMREVMRVLVPKGVAYVKQGNAWAKHVKPRPTDVDEWTHYLHDASNNAVAHDRVVGPPSSMQWIAGPRHTRSHEHTPGINALVSTEGRIFYIADEGPIASVGQPPQWHLVARDAYNGILLWKRSFTAWFPHLINWGVTPAHLQRRLVAVGNRLYVTLGLHAPLSAVDAATGAVLKAYEETEGTEEVVYHNGVLLLAVRSVTAGRVAELRELAQLAAKKGSPLHARETAQQFVDRFRTTENKTKRAVLALDANTGRLLWKKEGVDTNGLRALSLCADRDRVFYQKGKDILCHDLPSGRLLWSMPAVRLRLVCDDSVFCADGQTIMALSAETGQTRWKQAAALCDVRDLFVANGSLWVGGFKPFPQKRGPVWGPYFVTQRDLATGRMLRQIEPENPGHHHRCYQNKATDRYILAGRRGTEFIDLESGEVREHSWTRGVCRYGVMPCNGLMYAPPHACACYVGAKVTGFVALASTQSGAETLPESPQEDRLQRGDAYDEMGSPGNAGQAAADWPTYRGNPARSGATTAAVAAQLQPAWQQDPGGRLSSPVVADGRVFVASIDTHTVHALNANSGEPLWSYPANGRVDSPPTIAAGRVLFGSRDGSLYCLRASDGALAWRFQGARTARRIMADGQLESTLPVHGSVLLQDDIVYFTTGRSSYLDGGIHLYRLDPETGKMLSRTEVYSPDPQTGKQPPQLAPYSIPGVRSDILTGDGQYVYLRDTVFDSQGRERPQGRPHLLTLTDFLDDAWPHRSYWIFGTHCSVSTGCSRQDKGLIYGRLLVADESIIYGYGRAMLHWSNQLQDGAYRLFARKRDDGAAHWAKPMKIHVRAMILADNVLFIAGPPIAAEHSEGTIRTDHGAMLLAIAASDGKTLAEYRLDALPVFDGMAAIANRLYLTLDNGRLVCMDGGRQPQGLASVVR